MEKRNDDITEKYKAVDLDKNPHGTDLKVIRQRERERTGRYYPVGDKCHTQIFVRDGEDPKEKIVAYLERISSRPKMWN